MSPKGVELEQTAKLMIKGRTQTNVTLPTEDIAKILLTPSKVDKCYAQKYTAILFKRWSFNFGKSAGVHWQKATRNNQDVEWAFSHKFEWGKARKFIMRKYGFCNVSYIGKKSAGVSGLELKSIVTTIEDMTAHAERVGNLMKDFKKNTTNNCYLDPLGCIVQTECNKGIMELLTSYSERLD